MTLTQKEQTLLKDLMEQEQLCAEKYTKYAGMAKDPQLKNLFSQIASYENKHYDTLNKMSTGEEQQPSGGGSSEMPTFEATYSSKTPDMEADCYLCSDLLATEKHTSSLYDTCIFEFCDENNRNILAGIQQQEQNHGKMIYDYMKANSMYS